MATFTTYLRDVDTHHHISENVLNVYPIFDEGYREGLNRKIIRHYWNQEIGFETVDMFLFNLQNRMNEAMPLFNQLYESTLITFDPLSTVDMRALSDSNSVANSASSVSGDDSSTVGNTSRSVGSQFPQTMLNESGDYATEATDVKSTSDTSSKNASSTAGKSVGRSKGATSTAGRGEYAPDLLMRLRASMINVDVEVIASLSDLFMGVWDNMDLHMPENTDHYYSPLFF